MGNRFSLWSSMRSYRQGPEPLAPDVDPGLNVVLGRNCPEILLCVPTLWVQPDPQQKRGQRYTVARIPSGPNKGFWYVAAASWNMKRIGNINPAVLPKSQRTHLLPKKTPKQCRQALGFATNSAVSANFNQFNDKCKGISMTDFVNAVWGHEGFGYNGGKGHQSLGETAAAEPQNAPRQSLVCSALRTLQTSSGQSPNAPDRLWLDRTELRRSPAIRNEVTKDPTQSH
jgi:hypothetical protein